MDNKISNLTAEQKERIEENRRKALEKRNQRLIAASSTAALNNNTSLNGSKIHSFYNSTATPVINENVSKIQSKATGMEAKVTCRLISRVRFEAHVGFNQDIIKVFKTIPSKIYDPTKKLWNFDLKDYKVLSESLGQLANVKIEPLPFVVRNAFKSRFNGQLSTDNIAEYKFDHIDQYLITSLMPFQKEGVCFGISKNGRVLIADDMGLGKTLQAICLACYYKSQWPLLIITPSSVKCTWAEELKRWVPSLKQYSIHVVTTSKEELPSAEVLIVSFDLFCKLEKELSRRNYQVVIVDESHFLKSLKTKRTKAVLPVLKRTQRVILLSGTPALSRPFELYPQIAAICPKLFGNFHDFGLRYCNAKQNSWGWDYSGSSNMTELQIILEECVLIRRLKSDVMNQLPPKQRRMVLLDPSCIKIHKGLKAAAKTVLELRNGVERHGALLTYFSATGPVKTPAVIEYIFDLLESGKRFLIFAHHQKVLDDICQAIDTKNLKYIRIDGKTTSEERTLLCDKFQCNVDYIAAVLSITAANVGLTLTGASRVIFAELFWNPGALVQAEDRAYRIGQQDSVLVDYLVAKGTADDFLWPLILRKLDVLNKAGLSGADFKDGSVTNIDQTTSKQSLMEDFFDKEMDLEQIFDSFELDESIDDFSPVIKKLKTM